MHIHRPLLCNEQIWWAWFMRIKLSTYIFYPHKSSRLYLLIANSYIYIYFFFTLGYSHTCLGHSFWFNCWTRVQYLVQSPKRKGLSPCWLLTRTWYFGLPSWSSKYLVRAFLKSDPSWEEEKDLQMFWHQGRDEMTCAGDSISMQVMARWVSNPT